MRITTVKKFMLIEGKEFSMQIYKKLHKSVCMAAEISNAKRGQRRRDLDKPEWAG